MYVSSSMSGSCPDEQQSSNLQQRIIIHTYINIYNILYIYIYYFNNTVPVAYIAINVCCYSVVDV